MNNLTTTTELTTGQAAGVGALLGGMLGVGIVAVIAVAILSIIAIWKIFTKAGEKGWKALIPVYNLYVLFKICGAKGWFWALFVAYFVSPIVSVIAGMTGNATTNADGVITYSNNIFPIIITCVTIFEVVVYIVANYKLAKAFKRGIGTTIGLIFLPNIFELILAFGSAKYDKKVLKK